MKNKIGLIIAIAALCVSVACVIVCCVVLSGNTKPAKGDEDLQYVLYLGIPQSAWAFRPKPLSILPRPVPRR